MKVDPTAEWPLRVDGATLRVFEYGTPHSSAPVLLLVHGYPDDHHVFDPLIAVLGREFRVISYDTRAAGHSALDSHALHNVRLHKLVDDLFAVIDSIPGRPKPVHLLGHDWGSIQAWDAMRDPRARSTFASYTSISGPSIDHLREYSRQSLLRPGRWLTTITQLGRSWYVYGFAIPGLGRLTAWLYRAIGWRDFQGIDLGRNPERGALLYRANILQRMIHGPVPTCPVPTTLIVPTRDRFLSPRLNDGVSVWAPDLTLIRVDGGHWWPRTHPEKLAALVRSRLADALAESESVQADALGFE